MKVSFSTYWREVVTGRRKDFVSLLMMVLLRPISLLYATIQYLRGALYRTGILNSQKLPIPVISIGNITVGGTGKTPVTAYLARHLLKQGYRVAVLSRGYGGSLEGENTVVSDGITIMLGPNECGDEPYLLAKSVPGLIVVIGTNRHAAGLMAIEQLSPDIFLLDDGFQHLRLHRDLNILLLDYSLPFGNGLTLPAGLLREPATAVRRSDLIILTRTPYGTAVTEPVSGKPTFAASHHLVDALPLQEGKTVPISSLNGHRFLAFAGIAQPEFFFSSLREKGLNVVHTLPFPDHATYDHARLKEITAAFEKSGAEYAITTEKDGVKLNSLTADLASVTYVARLDIEVEKHSDLLILVRNLLS